MTSKFVFLLAILSLCLFYPFFTQETSSLSTHLDIVFVLDTTGSMGTYIVQTKKIIESCIQKYQERAQNVQFGMVAYRDFPPEDNTYITKILQLGDASKALSFLKELRAEGGGDLPEAVLKGLYDASTSIEWRNFKNEDGVKYKKVIIHAGDCPPHGKIFSDLGTFDEEPRELGGKNVQEVAKEINERGISYVFCKITDMTEKMESIFKELFKEYAVLDNSMKPENEKMDKEDYKKYRESSGKYTGGHYDYDALSSHEKEAIMYESKVVNYATEL